MSAGDIEWSTDRIGWNGYVSVIKLTKHKRPALWLDRDGSTYVRLATFEDDKAARLFCATLGLTITERK